MLLNRLGQDRKGGLELPVLMVESGEQSWRWSRNLLARVENWTFARYSRVGFRGKESESFLPQRTVGSMVRK